MTLSPRDLFGGFIGRKGLLEHILDPFLEREIWWHPDTGLIEIHGMGEAVGRKKVTCVCPNPPSKT